MPTPRSGRKTTLITHVEEDLALKIKKMADDDGRTASSLIRLILLKHVDKGGKI